MQSRKSPQSIAVDVRHSFSKNVHGNTAFDIVKSMTKEKEGLI